jgi:hypothetical protein
VAPVGFHQKAVHVGKGVGRSNNINIIGFAITFGAEVTL